MNNRKHCTDCNLGYTDENAHELVHEAVASTRSPGPGSGEVLQLQEQPSS